jgi:MFS family permease
MQQVLPHTWHFPRHIWRIITQSDVAYFTGIIGFSQSAVLLMLLNILYEISPRENRTTYIAFYNLATNLTLIVAPWVGMKIYKLIDFKDSFVLIAALRLASSLLFIKKPKNLSEDPSVCINVTK